MMTNYILFMLVTTDLFKIKHADNSLCVYDATISNNTKHSCKERKPYIYFSSYISVMSQKFKMKNDNQLSPNL